MTRIHLQKEMFGDAEQLLIAHGDLTAWTFRYPSGVAALKLVSPLGQLVLLPFQGQQIWSAEFGGRNLTMKSMFSQPHPTRTYLETYGAFLLHCGFTAMGVPVKEDSHPLHGETPNAPYDTAWIDAGEDEQGRYLRMGGSWQYTVAFSHNYLAEPTVTLHENSSIFDVVMTLTNLRHVPMEYMYMAHVNFRPVDNGELICTAPTTPERVRVRRSIPSHMKVADGYRDFIEDLAVHPEKATVLKPGLAFDPEVVFFIDFDTDGEGWAHSLQRHPDGSADYIAHRPDQLDHGVRWISRTPDQDCLGIILPATAESEGYTTEKAKGNVKLLGAGEKWVAQLRMGYLAPEQAEAAVASIREIVD